MLSAMAEKHEINLIVIGTHGRRGVEKMLLGSIAEEILRCAQGPVLMVGPESSVAPETEARPRRILYATDFSPESEPAMHYACTLAKEYKATLFFLHVAEDVWKEPITTRMQAADFFSLRLAEKHWVLEEGVTPEFRVEFNPVRARMHLRDRRQVTDRTDRAGCARYSLSASGYSFAWTNSLRCGFSCALSRVGHTGRTSTREMRHCIRSGLVTD